MSKKVDRVVTALRCGTPDMVPYIYNIVMRGIQERIVGHPIAIKELVTGFNVTGWLGGFDEKPEVEPALSVAPEVAKFLDLDAIEIQVLPPLFVQKTHTDTEAFVGDGLLDSAEAIKKAKAVMPDPDDNTLLRKIEDMIKEHKGEFAMGARIRLGASPTILSVGMENLSYFSVEEEENLHEAVALYANWSKKMNKNLNEMPFDFFWTFDDVAFDASTMFSPKVFKEFFVGPLKDAASVIDKPLIYHSDGNYQEFIEDVIDIGANALHPIERGSMDHVWLKKTYGGKLCMVGNIDMNHTLSKGTEEEVFAEVKARMDDLGPGGGYIISDSNSVPDFCSAKCIVAMSKAVAKYRHIY